MGATLAAAAISGGLGFLGSSRAASATESAAGRAADAQLAATQMGIDAQREMFDISRRDVEPWRRYGVGALELLGQGFGLERAPEIDAGALRSQTPALRRPGGMPALARPGGMPAPATPGAAPQGRMGALQEADRRDAYIDAIARTRHGRAGHSAIEYDAIRDQVATQFGGLPIEYLSTVADANVAQLPGVYGPALEQDLARAGAVSPLDEPPGGDVIDGDYRVINTGEGGEFTEPLVFDPGEFTEEDLRSDPSYLFRLNEGLKAQERAAAAGGYLGSGRAGKAMTRYASDLASTEFGQAYNRWYGRAYDKHQSRVADLTNRFNRLAAMSGIGQTAATQQAGLAGQAGSNIANLYGQQGANLGNIAMSSGNTLASLYANQGNAAANAVTQGYQNYLAHQNQQRYMGILDRFVAGGGSPVTGGVPIYPQGPPMG